MTISNFEKIMNEAKRKTIEWLAIKQRLIEKGYDKNDFKIKIGCWYCYDNRPCDENIVNKYERYPIYLNVCEDYHNSFRLDTDKRYNSARSIFELIIYKEEWYDSMYFVWDTDSLETYKYLLFKNRKEFKETDANANYFDSKFENMCLEEEMLFRG